MRDIVAVVFDFDDTLAPDSTTGFLRDFGLDPGEFWGHANRLIAEEGWDPIPVYLYLMLETSRGAPPEGRITREKLASYGKRLTLHKGVTTFFDRLRSHVAAIDPDTVLEFYLISSGIGEILRSSKIAKNFREIYACDFAYGGEGEILFPKNVVSFTEKTRFLFNISKGIPGSRARTNPSEVNRRLKPDEYRIPFQNMVFVGDGYTDIPCFALVKRYHGVTVAVYDPKRQQKWGTAWGFIEDNRVNTLLPAEYGANSALESQLRMALERMVRRGKEGQ